MKMQPLSHADINFWSLDSAVVAFSPAFSLGNKGNRLFFQKEVLISQVFSWMYADPSWTFKKIFKVYS